MPQFDPVALKKDLEENHDSVCIFEAQELLNTLNAKNPKATSHAYQSLRKSIATYGPLSSAIHLKKVIKELGLLGKVVFKKYNGKLYAVLKGDPKLRSILRGTRYSAGNGLITQFGIGRKGLKKAVKGGSVFTFVAYTGANVMEYILNDEFTLSDLLGATAVDLIKTALSGLVAFGVGVGLTATTFVAGPLFVAALAGFAAGYALDYIDDTFQISEKLVDFIDESIHLMDDAIDQSMDYLGDHFDQTVTYLFEGNKTKRKSWDDLSREYWQINEAMKRGWTPW